MTSTPTSLSDVSKREAHEGFPLVFGLDTFGDVTQDADHRASGHAETIRNVVGQGVTRTVA